MSEKDVWIRGGLFNCSDDDVVCGYGKPFAVSSDNYVSDDILRPFRSYNSLLVDRKRSNADVVSLLAHSRQKCLWQPTRSTSPYCVLCAEGVQDDFYTSCISWGKENVVLALQDEVLLFRPSPPFVRVAMLNVRERGKGLLSNVTSVAVSCFSDSSCFLGELDGSVGIYSSCEGRFVPSCKFLMPVSPLENTPFVGKAAMSATTSVRCFATSNEHPWLVAAGTAAQGVFILDSRSEKPAKHMESCDFLLARRSKTSKKPFLPEDCLSWISSADGVCGVSWNASGSLVATGGSNGVVNIWSISNTRAPVQQIRLPNEHTTVRAVAFHPTNPYELAVGGGINDGVLRLYDVSSSTSQLAWCVSTGCQVMQVIYSPDGSSLVSAHGSQCVKTFSFNANYDVAAIAGGEARSQRSPTHRFAGGNSDGQQSTIEGPGRLTDEFERGVIPSDGTENPLLRPGLRRAHAAAATGDSGEMSSTNNAVSPFSLVMWKKGTKYCGSALEDLVSTDICGDKSMRRFQQPQRAPLLLAYMYAMKGHRSRPLHISAPFLHTSNQGCVASVAGGIDNTIRFWKCFTPNSEAADWEQQSRAVMKAAVTDENMERMTAVPFR